MGYYCFCFLKAVCLWDDEDPLEILTERSINSSWPPQLRSTLLTSPFFCIADSIPVKVTGAEKSLRFSEVNLKLI